MAAMNMAFDVETAVSQFLADSTRTSLELPRMTTGERKYAKKVADSYGQLTCESFGFGQERQLHLFKKEMTDACPTSLQRTSVTVKNTFIDDFINGEVQDSVMFRSMPPQLTKKDTLGSIMESSAKLGFFNAERGFDAASTDCSTNASVISSPAPSLCMGSPAPSVCMGSPASSPRGERAMSPPPGLRELPLNFRPPPGLEVRNTFIHFAGAAATENKRAVQSMPHGMFGQCLWEEFQAATAPSPAPAYVAAGDVALPTNPSSAPGSSPVTVECSVIAQGTQVVIQGLTKCPAFNGQSGEVQSFDGDTGRYTILFNTPPGDGRHKTAKVKGDNLLVIAASPPPPPRHTPSLVLDDCCFQGAALPGFPSTPMWGDYNQAAHTLTLTALV